MPEVIVQRGFLSRPECEAILGAALTLPDAWSGCGVWQGRLLYLAPIQAAFPLVGRLMLDAADRAMRLIGECYRLEKPLYADTVHVARWDDGTSMRPHADRNESLPHRAYSSVIYLNDDYDGGALFFEHDIVVPEIGTLAAFSAGPEHTHWVGPVICGTRYTMPAFYTHDAEKREVVATTR